MIKKIYALTEENKKIEIGTYDDGFYLTGGTIFYIDPSSDESVGMYDENFNGPWAPQLGATYKYYKIIQPGTNGKHKIYVYDNKTGKVSGFWGYDSIKTEATGEGIGDGRINTSTILSIQDTSEHASSSIWKYLVETQNYGEGTNGCNDWYIGSKGELKKLENLTATKPFKGDYLWTSTASFEDTSSPYLWAYYKNYDSYSFISGYRNQSYGTIFVRSF